MSISVEEKNCYLRETAIVLAREGFHTDRTNAGRLRVLLDGAPLCEVTENGGITYRNEDIDEPERIDAKDKVYEIVRTTAEYMRQMETAPFLKADGLEDGYKVLADFNGIVLAAIVITAAVHPICIPCNKAAEKRSPPPREDCAYFLDPGEVHDGPPRRTHSIGDLGQRRMSKEKRGRCNPQWRTIGAILTKEQFLVTI